MIVLEHWECTLSPQQKDILKHLRDGKNYRQIARETGISEATIKQQAHRIRKKKLKNTAERVNKKGTFNPLQSQSEFFETPPAGFDGDAAGMIRELETSKGLDLTPLQKEVVALKISGKRPKEIAAVLGISHEEADASLEQIRKEIRRVQYDVPDVNPGACEYLPSGLTVIEAQVLSCISSGMSVNTVSKKMGKSVNAVKKAVYRSGTSVKRIKAERKKGPRFKTNNYKPVEKDWDDSAEMLLRLRFQYYTGELSDKKDRIGAEVILRSAGLIKAAPAIRQSNAQILNMISNTKGKRIFYASMHDCTRLNQYVHELRGSILDYAGATLITTNRYAEEEEESEGSSFIHTYAVDKKFWPAIQAVAGARDNDSGSVTTTAKGGTEEGRIDSSSRVVLRLLETNETLEVCMPGYSSRSGGEEDTVVMSPRAPLVDALYGKKAGERLDVKVGNDRVEYEVLEVI